MRRVEDAVRAQARDPRTTQFNVKRLTREGAGKIFTERRDGTEIYCGWSRDALGLVKKWWLGQEDNDV